MCSTDPAELPVTTSVFFFFFIGIQMLFSSCRGVMGTEDEGGPCFIPVSSAGHGKSHFFVAVAWELAFLSSFSGRLHRTSDEALNIIKLPPLISLP